MADSIISRKYRDFDITLSTATAVADLTLAPEIMSQIQVVPMSEVAGLLVQPEAPVE